MAMNKVASVSIAVMIVVGILFLAGVCWHSVGEIHYLKTFYPSSFNIDQAYEATRIEAIKVGIIAFPVIVAIAAGLYVLKNFSGRR
ncbi:hypothetical protein LPW11_12380 [Geomonas sp. RF6]|uniref:hypothetical protein n=1 Tax=Geomonas sp. RF6 TaxID=2897342 RepID=UPI001E640180|nr:hypothetical protein [Geomonas sp. RF6]UFS68706.1 hypothetical protein LPW11_12380 [Geomonas sp. RF6]